MLYQPTYPNPYLNTIDVDLDEGNIFKCLINPKTKVVGYEICIMSNDDNSVVYMIKGFLENDVQKKQYSTDGQKWTDFIEIPSEDSILPLQGSDSDNSWLYVNIPKNEYLSNGNDYKWNISIYETKCSIKFATGNFTMAHGNRVDGTTSGYRIKKNVNIKPGMLIKTKGLSRYITTVDNTLSDEYTHITTGESFGVDIYANTSYEIYTPFITSYDYYFKARKTPVITLEVEDTINSAVVTFNAEYAQEQDAEISYYCFNLYEEYNLVDSTGNVYSNDMTYTYKGFIAGEKYSIELIVADSNGFVSTIECEFNVDYEIKPPTLSVETYINKNNNSIVVDFSKESIIQGQIEGESEYRLTTFKNSPDDTLSPSTNAIQLKEEQNIYWNSINDKDLSISSDGTTVLHWHGHLGFNGNIIEMTNNLYHNEILTAGYNGTSFYYRIGLGDYTLYNPYTGGQASAIAGRDEYSFAGQITDVSSNKTQITIPNSSIVKAGMMINVGGETRKIISVTSSSSSLTLTLESGFNTDINASDNFFIFDETVCYILNDTDIIADTDVVVENDLGNSYWWLIIILPNEVKFIRTKRYENTVVKE